MSTHIIRERWILRKYNTGKEYIPSKAFILNIGESVNLADELPAARHPHRWFGFWDVGVSEPGEIRPDILGHEQFTVSVMAM
jgi:hypothetical protein